MIQLILWLSRWKKMIRLAWPGRQRDVRSISSARSPCRRTTPKNFQNPFLAVCRRAMISESNSRAGLLSLVREALLNPILVSLALVARRGRRALPEARFVLPLILLGLAVLFPFQCLGQGVHHPFAVGVNEGA